MIRLTGSLCELATLPTLFFYLMVMTSSRRIINDFNMKCVPLKHFFFFVMGFSTVASFTGMEAYIRATESTAIFFLLIRAGINILCLLQTGSCFSGLIPGMKHDIIHSRCLSG